MSWAAAIGASVAVTAAGVNYYSASRQKKKAKEALAKLNAEKPVETIPEEVIKNQQLASLRAKTGLPSEQYALAMKNIQRQQAKTLKSANDRRMGLGILASIDDNANRAQGNLDAENANARRQNERVSMDVNNQVANWKKGIFDRNVRQVWDRNFDYNMGLLGSANQNKANAINSGLGAVASFAGSAATGGAGGRSNSGWATNNFGNGSRARGVTFSGGGTQQQLYDSNGNAVYLT